jgi:hypothetical protein
MALDLRQDFAKAYPEADHLKEFTGKGSRHPGYNDLDCAATLVKFCAELLPQSPFTNPLGKQVKIEKGNFTKLVHLEHLTLTREEFSAKAIIGCIEDGTLNLAHYAPMEQDRMRTLFWIPELITDPDAIYRNGHENIVGNEVYVRNYDKMGSKIKLLFTMDIMKNRKYIRTVPVTSFLTDPEKIASFVSGQPKYRRAKTEEPPE